MKVEINNRQRDVLTRLWRHDLDPADVPATTGNALADRDLVGELLTSHGREFRLTQFGQDVARVLNSRGHTGETVRVGTTGGKIDVVLRR